MAKRLSVQTTKIESWDGVDEALKRIAEINATVSKANATAELKRLAIDGDLKDATETILEEKKLAERNIELFCKDNRDAFDDTRTKTFNFGLVKLRWLPNKLVTRAKMTWAKVLEELKRKKMAEYIRVKEEPDKEGLKQLDVEKLRALGMDLVQDEEFYYEAFKKDVQGAD